MDLYTVKQRMFIVRTYWKTDSKNLCQLQFMSQFVVLHSTLNERLKTKEKLLDIHEGDRLKLPEAIVCALLEKHQGGQDYDVQSSD